MISNPVEILNINPPFSSSVEMNDMHFLRPPPVRVTPGYVTPQYADVIAFRQGDAFQVLTYSRLYRKRNRWEPISTFTRAGVHCIPRFGYIAHPCWAAEHPVTPKLDAAAAKCAHSRHASGHKYCRQFGPRKPAIKMKFLYFLSFSSFLMIESGDT